MKDLFRVKSKRVFFFAVVALMAGVTAGTVSATEWKAAAGAQSADLGNVALAFLPNELWIHAGDSDRWFSCCWLGRLSRNGLRRAPA